MTSSFDSAGYDDLRSYVKNNWNWLAIVNGGGTEVLRWDISTNSNVTATSDATNNPFTVEVQITGQDLIDAGYSLPQTLVRTEAYKTSGASTRMADDTMTDATLEDSGDSVTITHDYSLPP